LFGGQVLHKWLYHSAGGKAKYKAKGNGYWQSWQSLAPNGQKQQRQAKANEYGHKAGNCCRPVTIAGGFPHQHRVEYKSPRPSLMPPEDKDQVM